MRYVIDRLPNCTATFIPGGDHVSAFIDHQSEIADALLKAAG
jgi:hypothetical protein